MPDTLRTRIAAVLEGHVDPSHRYDLADAVLAELGLRQERVELLTRWVTEWQRDDDPGDEARVFRQPQPERKKT